MRASRRMALYSQGGMAFTFTGDCTLEGSPNGDWKITLKTSGNFAFTKMGNAKDGIDVFLVGGGGGGHSFESIYTTEHGYGHYENWPGGKGGSGYSAVYSDLTMAKSTQYSIVIGAGGNTGVAGGATTGFGKSVSGGSAGGRNGANGAGGSPVYEFGDNTQAQYCVSGTPIANSGNGGAGGVKGDTSGKAGSSGVIVIRNHRA